MSGKYEFIDGVGSRQPRRGSGAPFARRRSCTGYGFGLYNDRVGIVLVVAGCGVLYAAQLALA